MDGQHIGSHIFTMALMIGLVGGMIRLITSTSTGLY